MRKPRIGMLADRLTALLPENGLTVSRHDAKVRLQYDDSTITEREFDGAVALAAARRQITRTFGGAAVATWANFKEVAMISRGDRVIVPRRIGGVASRIQRRETV